MEALFEFLFEFFFEVFFTVLFVAPIELAHQALSKYRMPKWLSVILMGLIILLMLSVIAAIITGAVLMATAETESQKTWGIVLLAVGLTLFAGYVVFSLVRYISKKSRENKEINLAIQAAAAKKRDSAAIGQKVHIVIDRPLGSVHPVHDDIVYEVNYGYCPDYIGGDGEEHDAYVLGVDEPIEQIDGVIVAIIHRHNDNEDKWVVVPEDYEEITDEEIIEKTYFQEKYFSSTLIR